MGSRLRSVAFTVFFMLTACGGGSHSDKTTHSLSAAAPGILSVSAYYFTEPEASSADELLQRYLSAFDRVIDAGARGQFQSYHWNTIEPVAGQYNQDRIDEFTAAMVRADSFQLTQLVGIQNINTVTREVPAGLENVAWNDPAMIDAMKGLLDRLIPAMRNRVAYISIGNEVDAYFLPSHAHEMAAYKIFFDAISDYLHQQLPATKVGMTITANGWLGNDGQALAEMSVNSDVMIATYYPLNPDFTVQSPTAPAVDFPALLDRAANKPLVLQEVGYPSSEISGSSLQQQAEFIHQIFSAWRDSDGRIPFLNLFLLHDFDASLVNDFLAYYGNATPEFRAYLDSLGLRNRDNTDKPAWQAVREEASTF